MFVGCAAAATNTNGPDGGCDDNTTNKSGCADAAAQNFTDAVMRLLVQCIPKIKIQEQNNCEHPWLTDKCKEAISRKRAAFGQPEFVQKRDDCSQILSEAYQTFVQKTRLELLSLKKGSKQWWKQARQLMRSAAPQANMPTLKRDDGSWATSPTDKANLLSETFAAKSVLDAAETNLFSAVEFGGARMTDGFLPVRTRNVLAVLRDLDINSGTGPDQLSALYSENAQRNSLVPLQSCAAFCSPSLVGQCAGACTGYTLCTSAAQKQIPDTTEVSI